MENNDDRLVTAHLSDIVNAILRDKDCVCIPERLAKLIFLVCKNETLCHVQFLTDKDLDVYRYLGHHTPESPVLWSMTWWKKSSERWLREKMLSDERRKAKFVEDENIRRIVKRLRVTVGALDEEKCLKPLARQYLRESKEGNTKALEYFKVGKLAEKVEDI